MNLHWVQHGKTLQVWPVPTLPGTMGRLPDNDLVLMEPTVSSRHATIWRARGQAWVRDLGSSNGTFVNDQRVTGNTELHDGDVLRLGPHTVLHLQGAVQPDAQREPYTLVLDDLTTGVRFPLRSSTFCMGPAEDSDLVLPHQPESVHVEIRGARDATLVTGDTSQDISLGVPFTVGEHRLVVREVDTRPTNTVDLSPNCRPYHLQVSLNGPAGPFAMLLDPKTGRRHQVTAETRATLLFVLARSWLAEKEHSDEQRGWCADEDVALAIWGRRVDRDRNAIHVVIHRLRRELEKADFDPGFIEKRRRVVRIRLPSVTIDP